MKDNNLQQLPMNEAKKKQLTIEENKIKSLESRLMGPSSDGNLPAECQPLQDADLENIKCKFFMEHSGYPNKNQNNNTINEILNDGQKIPASKRLKRKKQMKSKKTYLEMLNNKRKRETSSKADNENNGLLNNYITPRQNNKNSSNNNELLPKDLFSSKNCSLPNNQNIPGNNTTSGKKKKQILDYYAKIPGPLYNQNYSPFNLKGDNIPQIPFPNQNSSNKSNSSSNSGNADNINYRKEYINILNELNNKNKLLEEKEKEIENLSKKNEEMEQTIEQYVEINKNLDFEVRNCRMNLCRVIKENAEYERKLLKKKLTEQQYSIGKIGMQKTSHGQILDYFEDGEEIIEVRDRLTNIKSEREELDKQKKKLKSKLRQIINSQSNNKDNPERNSPHSPLQNQNLGSTPPQIINYGGNYSNLSLNTEQDSEAQGIVNNLEMINFKINNLIKEETELKDKKERLSNEKTSLISDLTLLNQESKCSFLLRRDPWPLLAGRYQTLSLLGKGGYSEVYKAYDLYNHCYVAVKLHQLSNNWNEEVKDNYIKHTERENLIHKQFDHPAILRQYDTIAIDNESFCTVLEYCTGPDLGTYIKRNKSISEKDARIIITQILLGLEYLNKLPQKIIHYDLKPENIIFNNYAIKISDFGLAKIMDTNKDKIQLTSQGVGTYWYLPPECFKENKDIDIDAKVDIWSVGVILYEMLFRTKPFGQNYSQNQILRDKIMTNVKKVEFPSKPVISEDCKEFIKGCLEIRQENRFDVFEALNSKFIKNDKTEKKEKNTSQNLNGIIGGSSLNGTLFAGNALGNNKMHFD
ncbi:MAG: protein kinase [archaeon]|nr:protein kinase [archaeon]